MSDPAPTPETDAFDNLGYQSDKLFAHARKLERERDELRRELELLKYTTNP